MTPFHQSQAANGSVDRRAFLGTAAAVAAAAAMPPAAWADEDKASKPEICAFIKFIQALSYDDMAASVAEIGFDGVESTVRRNGHVLPERVKDDLPRQYEAVKAAGLDMTMMTTDVLRVDDPHVEDVLRTGAALGVTMYRMGFYRYDRKRSVMDQLNEIRPQLRELAALNRELGLTAVYQNHCGANFVGASVWDLKHLLEGIPKSEIGSAFDIRHATVEGGLSWPLDYDVIKPHIGAVYVKDYVWREERPNKPEHVPLGTGRVDPKFFKMHLKSGVECPISLHVEYLQEGSVEENLAALRRDLQVLNSWLEA